MRTRLLVAILCIAPCLSVAAEGDALRVSLVTLSPGEIYWQRFGHNLLVIQDGATGEARAYHWGLFDFEQENFFLNFARGRMRYQIGVGEAGRTLAYYRREGRSAVEQRLNLTPARRAALDRFLRWNAQPENAEYTYDYFRDNCSTRLRDALDGVLDGQLRQALAGRATAVTFRAEAVRLLWPDRVLALGMDLLLGPSADRPLDRWEAGFSPVRLMQDLRRVTVSDNAGGMQPLVADETELYRGHAEDAPADYPRPLITLLAAGLLMAGALLGPARRSWRRAVRVIGASWLLVLGVAGLVSLGLWTLTEHWAGWRNPLLLVLNPLCLLLLPGWLRSAGAPSRLARGIGVVVLAMAAASPVVLWAAGAAHWQWLALLLPLHAVLAYLLLWHNSRPSHET